MVVAVAPSVAACLQLEHNSNYREGSEGSGVLLISAPEKLRNFAAT